MTSLVATQTAKGFFSMSNKQGHGEKKRPIAAYLEQDGGFQFLRKSKTEGSAGRKTTQRGGSVTNVGAQDSFAVAIIPTVAPKSLSKSIPTQFDPPESSQPKLRVNHDVLEDEATKTTGKPANQRPQGADTQGNDSAEGLPLDGACKPTSPNGGKVARPIRRWEPSPTPRRPTESTIAPPTSDTPTFNRHKDIRKKGGKGNRRSSLESRGRRASSLLENGQTPIPHRDVNPTEFYKHIETKGLIEPKRMMQLLMWCGERALPAKRRHGTPNSNAMLGARAIQVQILKDFAQQSKLFNWFSRDEDALEQPAILKHNPRNIELDEKLVTLEKKIKKLKEEKQAWLAIRQLPPDMPPIFSNGTPKIELPDFKLLGPREVKIRNYLVDKLTPFANIRFQTEERLRKIQTSLEFEVDQLANNVHILEQRVLVAGRQADKVLSLSAQRLKEREQKEKKSAGSRDMPLMEVLKSLSKVLTEGNA